MKKLNITKERFEKSRYFTKKYGKLAYVSESGRLFKTNKGKVLMFKENYNFSDGTDEGKMLDERLRKSLEDALNKAHDCFANELEKQGFKGYDGDSEGGFYFNDLKNRKTYYVCLDVTDLQECDDYEGDFDDEDEEQSFAVNEAIPKTLKEIPQEQAEKLIQKHLRAGTGEWEDSPGYSDFIYEIGGGRYKLIRPGFGGRYETGIVSM